MPKAYGRTSFRGPRAPTFKYRAPMVLPHDRRGQVGEWEVDAVSGAFFPAIYAVDGPYGLTDGRDGATTDLDQDLHEFQSTMVGPQQIPRP